MARHARFLLALSSVLVIGAAPFSAAPAQKVAGSAIVYRCGNDFENLCRFTFDGAPPKQAHQ